jgi:hypothetical protein
MIKSFYFIALTMTDQSILTREVVVCCQFVQPIIANEAFLREVFFEYQTNDLVNT